MNLALCNDFGVLIKNHEDDPDTYDGAPVGLQIVARKWEEEKVWAIAKILDTALKNRREEIPR